MLSFFYLVILGLSIAAAYFAIEWFIEFWYSWPFEE